MELIYMGIVAFLLLLAVFDLFIGVSNDAVNFLNSAVGAKVASYKTIVIIAALGVFIGASMSNGMMDIARHGIFQPSYFTFYEVMAIFVAVMVTDVIILDIFNSLGMPTSTTVSLVFELLGATFFLSLIKIMSDTTGVLNFGTLINTEKALSVILGIFLSVAVAFITGSIIQFISRTIFTFNYKKNMKWAIGIFGGISITALSYFILIKGLQKTSFIDADTMNIVKDNTALLLLILFVFFTILMQVLHSLKVNVLKIIILLGTFSLALAFAGNDLVNFIGVPLAGLSSFQDFQAQGGNDVNMLMSSLNESAKTPFFFLLGAGLIMIYSLATSKKAKNVIKTSIDLSRQGEGDEMFGSSAMARSIVRNTNNMSKTFNKIIPNKITSWTNSRFDKNNVILEKSASFDHVRASVNLVVASLLIIVGTNLKLPLSTTYVTFIVAMGTSLSDRAWSRESAVYRITGVLSVIGGWFITAFTAFLICGLVALAMYFTGFIGIFAFIALAAFLLVRNNKRYNKSKKAEKIDDTFNKLIVTKDKAIAWELLKKHISENQMELIKRTSAEYDDIIDGVVGNNLPLLKRANKNIKKHKIIVKKIRQRELVGMRLINNTTALEYNTWFHLCMNSSQQLMYNLVRMVEPAKEHVDNDFTPLTKEENQILLEIRSDVVSYIRQIINLINSNNFDKLSEFLYELDNYKTTLSSKRKILLDKMQDPSQNLKSLMLCLNIVQESQEMVSTLRHLLRAYNKIKNQ